MKFLSSSSFSTTTSSSTASFNANMCNSRSATAGCLAGVLRRLLCSGSLPTHPSDQIRDSESTLFGKDENLTAEEKVHCATTPGIVARLMGLDSSPEINLVCSQIKGNSIVRCRSMNSVDFLPDSEALQGKHRRVKSSLSSREGALGFFEMESEDYFLLSFDNGAETKELGPKQKKCEMGFGELRQRTTEKCRNRDSRRGRVSEKNMEYQAVRKKITTEKEELRKRVSAQIVAKNGEVRDFPRKHSVKPDSISEEGAKLRKKKRNSSKAKKVEPEPGSENSSPVSVLDFGECVHDPELPTSEENLNSIGSNSRRKLSPELENYNNPSPKSTINSIRNDVETKKIEGKSAGSRKKACHSQDYLAMWTEICRSAGGEMMESKWTYKEMQIHEDFSDLIADFGLQIMDELLQELVDQLSKLPMKI